MDSQSENAQGMMNFASLLLCLSGADIVAPETIVEPKLAQFKEIKSTDDSVIDTSCVLAGMDSSTARTELVKLLSMRFLPLTDVMKLHSFLGDYIKEMIEYTHEHHECREENSSEKAMQKMREMFG